MNQAYSMYVVKIVRQFCSKAVNFLLLFFLGSPPIEVNMVKIGANSPMGHIDFEPENEQTKGV
jgi:hypothetical protein